MHILEIVPFLPPFGGYFAIEQAQALLQAGNRVGMLYCQQLGIRNGVASWIQGNAGNESWIRDLDLDILQRNFRGLPRMVHQNMERFCVTTRKMYDRYVKENGKPDVLHAHCAMWTGIAAQRISQREGIPYYITEHTSRGCYEQEFGLDWQRERWAMPLLRSAYEQAACVIPVAEELVESTKDFFGNNYKYKAISNITDTDFFRYAERKSLTSNPSTLTPMKFRFCCLASAQGDRFYLKGYDVLARAMETISHNRKENSSIELHIAGIDTDTRQFRELFEKHYGRKIEPDRVFIHGNLKREQVRELLYHCDALVHASRSEVQPLVIMEALSTGIPVVATECLPLCERFREGVLIAPVGDAKALKNKMLDAMQIAPSVTFHDQVAQISSSEMVAKQLIEVFNS